VTEEFEVALIALTVWGEARGESYPGKLAVANVICNRARRQNVGISRVVLKAWQFSFWNTDDPSRDRISEIDADGSLWQECLRAATSAYKQLEPDPTNGAEFYMNIDVVKRSRGGTLPKWWNIDTTPEGEVVIGRHTFRRRKV
jgi:N-acetylmuramoyl-L-alanine amidase